MASAVHNEVARALRPCAGKTMTNAKVVALFTQRFGSDLANRAIAAGPLRQPRQPGPRSGSCR